MLAGTFDEYHLHELVKQRWRILEVGEKLLGDQVEVWQWKLIQQNSNLAHHFIELILFCQNLLPKGVRTSLFVRKVELSHVVWTLFIRGPQSENEINGIDFPWSRWILLSLILGLRFLLFSILIFKWWLIPLKRINSAFCFPFLWWDRLHQFCIWVLLITRSLDDFVWLGLVVGVLSSHRLKFLVFVRIHRFLVWSLWIGISNLIIFILLFGRFLFLWFRRVLILPNLLFGFCRIVLVGLFLFGKLLLLLFLLLGLSSPLDLVFFLLRWLFRYFSLFFRFWLLFFCGCFVFLFFLRLFLVFVLISLLLLFLGSGSSIVQRHEIGRFENGSVYVEFCHQNLGWRQRIIFRVRNLAWILRFFRRELNFWQFLGWHE